MGPKCYAVQCIVDGEENPQNCPFPLEFCHPARGRSSHGDIQHAQKSVKIAHVVREVCSWTDTHTRTDALIIILCHRSSGRISYKTFSRAICWMTSASSLLVLLYRKCSLKLITALLLCVVFCVRQMFALLINLFVLSRICAGYWLYCIDYLIQGGPKKWYLSYNVM